MIEKVGKTYNTIEKTVLILALMVMVIVTFAGVVMRYLFNSPLFWSEEFVRYLFIWFSWLGASAGLKDNLHLKVELLGKALVRRGLIKTNEVLTLAVLLLWLATTIIVTYYGTIIVSMQLQLGVLTPAMRMPLWVGYLSIPFCGGLIAVRIIVKIIESVKTLLGRSGSARGVTE